MVYGYSITGSSEAPGRKRERIDLTASSKREEIPTTDHKALVGVVIASSVYSFQTQFSKRKQQEIGYIPPTYKEQAFNMAQSGPSSDFRPVELGAQDSPHTDVSKGTGEKKEQGGKGQAESSESSNHQYLLRKFFVARPGAFDQAVQDLTNQLLLREKESVHSAWLLVEIDHWNNEKERVVLIADSSIFICKYDFIMLCSQEIQKVPLNFIDRICRGPFTFPQKSVDKRAGEGLRIYWDKLREPSFISRWNPLSSDLPYTTFIDHPLTTCSGKLSDVSQISGFADHLVKAVQEAHTANPVPGRANGVLILNQPLLIETYVGIMSFVGNRNKLGYSLARGSVGF
ncbi:tumor protein p63-regulated gene 1 protein [Mixophyes fleayi]|uniref:tumor protein p63-regulated gene 1 protein n=1 Tax=Mixophyes fleayi TaxID=3061075 RepID=UPI003F4D8F77